jgi:zinc transporter
VVPTPPRPGEVSGDPAASADPNGLVAAHLLDGHGGGPELDWERVRLWQPEDGLLWVHLDCTVPAARHWLLAESGLAPLAAEALVQEETRPRTVAGADGLLVMLRGVNLNPGAEPDDMVSIRIFLTPGRIVSTRRRLRSVDDLRAAIREGRGPATPGAFLVALADRLMAPAAGVIENVEDAVDRLEEEVLATESRQLRSRLADVRREVIGLRRYLAPQRDALARLQLEPTPILGDVERLRLREIADRVTRCVEDLDAARERAAVTHEELSGRLAEQMNQRMYVLSIVAALFLPLGFLTGLLGINVGGIPGVDDPHAFGRVTLMLTLLVACVLAVFKWRRWF